MLNIIYSHLSQFKIEATLAQWIGHSLADQVTKFRFSLTKVWLANEFTLPQEKTATRVNTLARKRNEATS